MFSEVLTAAAAWVIFNVMVNYNQHQLDLAFGALAHPIRRGILARLSTGEASISELAEPFKVSAPAITRHMKILEKAGLLSRKKLGREHRCRLEQKRMKQAQEWIAAHRKFWNEKLDALELYLKENP